MKAPCRVNGKQRRAQDFLSIMERAVRQPTVLKTIFRACDMNTLKACRLVCKTWHNLSLPFWQEIAVLDVRVAPRIPILQLKWTSEDVTREELMQLLPASKEEGDNSDEVKILPQSYRKCRLSSSSFYSTEQRVAMLPKILGDICGPSLTLLSLSEWPLRPSNLESSVLLWAPNLERLILWKCAFSSERAEAPVAFSSKLKSLVLICGDGRANSGGYFAFPKSLKNSLTYLKKLENLSLGFRHETTLNLEGLLESVANVRREDPSKLRLQTLSIFWRKDVNFESWPESVVQQLELSDLSLRALKLGVYSGSRELGLKRALRSVASSLEHLTLFGFRLPQNSLFSSFPFNVRLSHLQKLFLEGNLAVENFGFLKLTPSLKILHIFRNPGLPEILSAKLSRSILSDWSPEAAMEVDTVAVTLLKFDMEEVRLEGMEELQGDFNIESAESFEVLTSWMPNLKRLGVRLTDVTFPVVCRQWSHSLRKLRLPHDCNFGDEAFTGVPKGRNLRVGQLSFMPAERQPNITDLKELTSIIVDESKPKPQPPLRSTRPSLCQHTFIRLGDHSVLHGLIQLPKLRKLELRTPKLLSGKCIRLLHQRIQEVSIYRSRRRCDCGVRDDEVATVALLVTWVCAGVLCCT